MTEKIPPHEPHHPAWRPYAPLIGRIKPDRAAAEALNALLPPGTETVSGQPVRFERQDALGEQDYEQRIHESGRVATRDGSRHDVCNALAWARFPRIKAALNALHMRGLPDSRPGRRGPLRDAVTQFDECGMVLWSRDRDLLAALRERRWLDAFVGHRGAWEAPTRALLIGHGTLENLRQPFKSLTAKALLVSVAGPKGGESLESIDRLVAEALLERRWLERPADLSPLPIAGIPGWWHEAQDEPFYADQDVFRPPRPGATLAPIRCTANGGERVNLLTGEQ